MLANKTNDETILEILQGNRTDKWPSAKLVKIFINSSKPDFIEERRLLLEFVGPQLELFFEDEKLEVELVDMHFGSSKHDDIDPYLLNEHLNEIQMCHKLSKGCFLLNIIGDSYSNRIVPYSIDLSDYEDILKVAQEKEYNHDLLNSWYERKDAKYFIKDYRKVPIDEWREIATNIVDTLKQVSEVLDRVIVHSTVENQFDFALGLASDAANHIFSVTRELISVDNVIDNNYSCPRSNKLSYGQLQQFKQKLSTAIEEQNQCLFKVPWKADGINPDDEDHETYLTKFKNTILNKLQTITKKHLDANPELKSRKKIVEENFQENIVHLTLHFDPTAIDFEHKDVLKQLKTIVKNTANSRHNPILIYGNTGSGKSSLIRTLHKIFPSWFDRKLLRLVRYVSASPRSSYNLELLRIICQQICIALKLPEGFLPKDASFDPLYINNWFQQLLRMFEDMNQILVILIDDIHRLNPLDTDATSTLSWLPISLPKNCYLICTTGVELDMLRLSAVQKDRLRNSDGYVVLENDVAYVMESIERRFDQAEERFGRAAISRLAGYVTCSEYGLTETELLELLMPVGNSEVVISIAEGNFNFSTLCSARLLMRDLLRNKLMSGKILIEWSHDSVKDVAKRRYLQNQDTLRTIHSDIANIFFSEFCDDEKSESEEDPAPLPSDIKETPFQSTLHSDVTYSLRHIEEAWIHLLKAGDVLKLKSLTLCNYDFLLAAVQTLSVSYLRCILEHSRCYLLDREIELIYYAMRKATDILTRDTFQLGTQLIAWLRPVADKVPTTSPTPLGGLLGILVTAAMAWCDGFTLPLVVPLTDWLQPPLPVQARIMNTPSVRLVESTPSGQHVVCCVDTDPQLWHIMSNELVHTFKGHTKKVVCMVITRQSQYLLTGSEDASVIVWDLRSLTMSMRICEHIAPVLAITVALNNSVIVSGAEDSSIIISSLANGKRITKIDHHRGPISSLKITYGGDILVSGSQDATICLWSLETFTMLNIITLQSAVQTIDISSDSVFLLAACTDNVLYLRTLATGTELHSLSEHKSKVKTVCLTHDSCRAVLGCSDGRLYIYDVHSGKLRKTITGQGGEVSAVRITDKDDFLLTAGGNRIFFYPFRSSDTAKALVKQPKKSQHHLQAHRGYITCIDISRDGLLAVSGATDYLVNVWLLNSHELIFTLSSHTASITDVCFAPNTLFVATASEDRTVKIWGLTIGSLVATFKGHQAAVLAVSVMMDSTRIISSDRNDTICIWLADNGNLLQSLNASSKCVAVTNNMKYCLCMHMDTSLRIWSLLRDDEKYTISHSEEITCFVLTMDSLHVITGSRDMSLKVWQVSGGKLSQVLIGHTDAVTCVAVAVSDKSLVISGSYDCNLIVWDINTGADLFTLSAHLSIITSVKASGDGSIAISGSEDKSIIIWDTKRGLVLTSLQMHLPIIRVEPSSDFSRMTVLLKEINYMPIICLHNTPAKYVKLPTYCAPDKDLLENPKTGPKRQMRRLLKKEVSLDTYTWQKKYAHLTSNLVIPAIDERFKRRFSVSASMEEISKIPQKDGQGGLPNKQGSLAQSQHFDQLEALWNKRSPPRRKLHQSISKQSSLTESHQDSSDEDKFS